MTTPGGSDDAIPPADPAPAVPRVDGRAPVLDGRAPSLHGAGPTGRGSRPPSPAPEAPTTGPEALGPEVEGPGRPDPGAADGPERRSAPLSRRAAPTGAPRSSIAASARQQPERTRVPVARARVAATEPAAQAPAAEAATGAPGARATTTTLAPPAPDPVPEPAPTPQDIADRAIGRSLAQPPLPPPPGLGPTRRLLTVPPPSPPFVEADIPFHWRAALPSAIGRKVTIQVGDGKLDLGGTVVAIDQVRDVRFKLQVEAALFRRAASARMMVAMTLKDGSTVRVSARNAASARKAAQIVETLTYLWTLLSDTTEADERQSLVEKIDRGSEVQVGRLRLTGIGIAWKRHPIARWGTLGDPRRVGLDVVIPVAGGDPIVVPLSDIDAYQLPVIVPLLRQHFA